MKVRNGFVSNSSSSSFVLIGTTIPEFNTKEFVKDEFREAFIEDRTEFCENNNLYYTCDEDAEYVGYELDSLDYDKTINENINSVHEKLSKYFNVKKSNIDIIGGATYEG